MAAISTIIAGIGLAVGVAGTAAQVVGSSQQAAAAKRAENLRERQMNLEAARQRRQVIRNSLRARSMALTSATAQGAQSGSGLQGGFGQIGQQTGENIQGVNQGTEIGAGIFAANRDSAGVSSLVSFGQGLGSLGGALVNNADTLGRIGTFFGTPRTGG